MYRFGSRGVMIGLGAAMLWLCVTAVAAAQDSGVPRPYRSPNISVLSHVPLGEASTISDIELEQELRRPFAYVSRRTVHGFDIIDLTNPEDARLLYSWRIENAELHQGGGGTDGKYSKLDGRYYYIQSVQFGRGGLDSAVGAVVFDSRPGAAVPSAWV